jgi:hypothetical protein
LLKTRRVVLLEIDSGAKPGKPGTFAQYASVLFEPLEALNNAGYTNADFTRKKYDEALNRQFRQKPDLAAAEEILRQSAPGSATQRLLDEVEQIEQDGVPTFFHITYICNHLEEENVLTAWSLSPSDKALLLLRFYLELEMRRLELTQFKESANKFSVREELETLTHNTKSVTEKFRAVSSQYAQLTTLLEQMIPARHALSEQAGRLADNLGDEALRKEFLADLEKQKQKLVALRLQAAQVQDDVLLDPLTPRLEAEGQDMEAARLAAADGPDARTALKEFAGEETALIAAKEVVETVWVKPLHQKAAASRDDQKLFDQRTQSTRKYFEARPPVKQ